MLHKSRIFLDGFPQLRFSIQPFVSNKMKLFGEIKYHVRKYEARYMEAAQLFRNGRCMLASITEQ